MKKKKIEALNRLLKAVYYHGGDPGGPYNSNTEGVIEAVEVFTKAFSKVAVGIIRVNVV